LDLLAIDIIEHYFGSLAGNHLVVPPLVVFTDNNALEIHRLPGTVNASVGEEKGLLLRLVCLILPGPAQIDLFKNRVVIVFYKDGVDIVFAHTESAVFSADCTGRRLVFIGARFAVVATREEAEFCAGQRLPGFPVEDKARRIISLLRTKCDHGNWSNLEPGHASY